MNTNHLKQVLNYLLEGSNYSSTVKVALKKKVKVCIVCGNQHTHNNSFCSSTCAKEYKEHKK